MKPSKQCFENPVMPLHAVFKGHNWAEASATKQLAILAATMVCAFDVDTVIEIGIGSAFSTGLLMKALTCNAMENGLYICCDIRADSATKAQAIGESLPIETIVLQEDSKKVDWLELLNGRKVGLSYIDGDHKYDSIYSDLTHCAAVSGPDAIIAVHDYSVGLEPEVVKAVDEFLEKYPEWKKFYMEENRTSQDYRSVILQGNQRR